MKNNIKYLSALLLFVVAMPAYAQDGKNAVCKLLPKSNAANNVVYQPGVDAYGNAVVPADLNAAPMDGVLNMIKVPLNLDLARRVAGLMERGIDSTAPLGMLEVHENGQVKYNGEDWTKPILTLCGQSFKEVTVNEIMVESTGAQPDMPSMFDSMPAPEASVETYEVQNLKNEVEALKKELAVKAAAEAMEIPRISPPTLTTMPAVAAPKVEFLDEVTPTKERMANMNRQAVSEPASPIKPLVGIPKGTSKLETSDVLKGQDHRNYNE